MSRKKPRQSPPRAHGEDTHRIFAAVEQLGVRVALAVILAGTVLFLTGWLAPLLPVKVLSHTWYLPSAEFVKALDAPTGWQWLGLLGHSDMLALGGLVLLVLAGPAAYLALLVVLVRERDFRYGLLVAAQLAVFLVAAAGWLSGR